MKLTPSLSLALFLPLLPALAACGDDTTTEGTGGSAGTAGTAAAGMAGSGASGAGAGGTGAAGGGAGGAAGSGTAGSGTAGSGTAGGGAADYPSDTSQAGIEAYLAAQSYLGAGWRPETMPSDGTSQPHLAVKRYFNESLIASNAVNPNPTPGMPRGEGSMAVKEILEAGAVAGHAVLLRSNGQWIYYCKSSIAGRCASGSMPDVASYGTTAGACSCHGSGTIISAPVIPAP